MRISVHVASAFSKDHNGGNKAGVVFMDHSLSTKQKMEISKQLGYAETAFISQSKIADFKLTYFTPKEEVNLCGHATIGTFVVLMQLGKLSKNHYLIQTNSGVLNVFIKDNVIFMEQNKPKFYDVISPKELSDCFNIKSIYTQYPIQIVSTGLKDILVPIKNEKCLNAIQPNFERMKELSDYYNVIGMHMYTFNGDQIVCRNFAPLYDIDEESATGTSNGALACYLYTHQYLRKDLYVFEQGYSLNSPSEILVNLQTSNSKIKGVLVGGRGYYLKNRYINI